MSADSLWALLRRLLESPTVMKNWNLSVITATASFSSGCCGVSPVRTLSGGEREQRLITYLIHHVGALWDAGRVCLVQGSQRGQAQCLRGGFLRCLPSFSSVISMVIFLEFRFAELRWSMLGCRIYTRSSRLRMLHGRYVNFSAPCRGLHRFVGHDDLRCSLILALVGEYSRC